MPAASPRHALYLPRAAACAASSPSLAAGPAAGASERPASLRTWPRRCAASLPSARRRPGPTPAALSPRRPRQRVALAEPAARTHAHPRTRRVPRVPILSRVSSASDGGAQGRVTAAGQPGRRQDEAGEAQEAGALPDCQGYQRPFLSLERCAVRDRSGSRGIGVCEERVWV